MDRTSRREPSEQSCLLFHFTRHMFSCPLCNLRRLQRRVSHQSDDCLLELELIRWIRSNTTLIGSTRLKTSR